MVEVSNAMQQLDAQVERKELPKYRELLQAVDSLPASKIGEATAYMQGMLAGSAGR